AGYVVAGDEVLHRYTSLLAGRDERRCANGVGRIPPVDVGLEYRTTVDRALVLGLVLLGIVRVGGVRHVRGRDDGTGQGPVEVLTAATAREHDACEDRDQQGRHGTALRLAARLLVVEQDQHRDRRPDRCRLV